MPFTLLNRVSSWNDVLHRSRWEDVRSEVSGLVESLEALTHILPKYEINLIDCSFNQLSELTLLASSTNSYRITND